MALMALTTALWVSAAAAEHAEAAAAAAAVCAWCAATQPDVKLLRCGGCRQKFFCDNDKACLKHAWKSGHKQECKELQARRQQQQQKAAAPQLPAAMKTIPAWATGGGGMSTAHSSAAGAMFSDSFDGQARPAQNPSFFAPRTLCGAHS